MVEEVKAVAVMAVTDPTQPNPTQPTFSSADKFILAMPGESGDRGGAPSGSGGGDGGSSAARDAIAARCLLELAVRVSAEHERLRAPERHFHRNAAAQHQVGGGVAVLELAVHAIQHWAVEQDKFSQGAP